jgi:hypothetical protein
MPQEPWMADNVREVLSNPAYCLLVPPVITEEMWIKAGIRLINEIGAEAYRGASPRTSWLPSHEGT